MQENQKSLQDSMPAKIEEIFSLFNDFGEADYIGEPVSLIDHSL